MKKLLFLPLIIVIAGCGESGRPAPVAESEFKLPEIKGAPKIEGDGVAALSAVLEKYGAMKTYQSTISWTFAATGFNGKEQKAESERMVLYAAPNKHFVHAITGTMKFTSVSDGEKLLEYAGSVGKLSKPTAKIWQAEAENIRDPQIAGSFLFQLFRGKAGINEIIEPGTTITLVPSDKDGIEIIKLKARGRYGTTELVVDKATNFVQKITSQFEPLVDETRDLKVEDQLKSVLVTEVIEHIKADAPLALDSFDTKPPTGVSAKDQASEPEDLAVLSEGMKAPDFQLKSLDGEAVKLSALRGQVVLLDFWATWCLPCREALPKTIALKKKYGGKGLAVWSIPEEDGDLVRIFLKEQGFESLPVLIDPGKKTHKQYKIAAIPTYVVINQQGIIQRVFMGAPEIQDLLSSLREAGLPI